MNLFEYAQQSEGAQSFRKFSEAVLTEVQGSQVCRSNESVSVNFGDVVATDVEIIQMRISFK